MKRDIKKRFVSHAGNDLMVHIHMPTKRKPHPMCHPSGWEDREWRYDPADGLGAVVCKKCEIRWAISRERVKQKMYAKNRRYHARHREEIAKRKKAYDSTPAAKKMRRVYTVNKKRRVNEERRRQKSGDNRPPQAAEGDSAMVG